MFSVVLNISFPYIVDVLILLHLPVTISTRWVFPKVPAKCSKFRCDPFCLAMLPSIFILCIEHFEFTEHLDLQTS